MEIKHNNLKRNWKTHELLCSAHDTLEGLYFRAKTAIAAYTIDGYLVPSFLHFPQFSVFSIKSVLCSSLIGSMNGLVLVFCRSGGILKVTRDT